jgi:hypothetical protein
MHKSLRLLGLLLGLMLMVGFLAAPKPTLADAPTIAVVPASGPAGSDFGYAGVGFQPNAVYGIVVTDETGATTAQSTVTSDDNGQFSGTITVSSPGLRTLTIVGTDGTLSVTFTVTTPVIAISPGEIQDGGTVGYAGAGFAANTTYAFRVADSSGNLTVDSTVTTDDSGQFSGTLTVNGPGTRTAAVLTTAGALLVTVDFNVTP